MCADESVPTTTALGSQTVTCSNIDAHALRVCNEDILSRGVQGGIAKIPPEKKIWEIPHPSLGGKFLGFFWGFSRKFSGFLGKFRGFFGINNWI